MKKLSVLLLILLGMGIIGFVGYYGILFLAIKDFGMPPWPKPLYAVKFDGHKERLEQALLLTYQKDNLTVYYKNGSYFDLNVLTVRDNNNTVNYEFAVNYCKPIKNWVNYGWADNCNQSKISLYRILENSEVLFNFNDDKSFYPGMDTYIATFEKVLLTGLKINIENYPLYQWNKSFSSDSSQVSVFVVSEILNDTIAEHRFQKMLTFSDSYGQVFSEKYFGDSTIRYEYDEQGHYIFKKMLIFQDSSILNRY